MQARKLLHSWTKTLLLIPAFLICTAQAQSYRIDYSTLLGAEVAGKVQLLRETPEGHVWVGFAALGSECLNASRCTSLYLIDVRADRVLTRIFLPGLEVHQMEVRANGDLLVFGQKQSGVGSPLPHDPTLLWAAAELGEPAPPFWLGLIGRNGELQNGAYLRSGIALTAMHVRGGEVTVVASDTSACPLACARLQVAKVSDDLRQIAFDTQPTPAHANTASASTLATDGRLIIATGGDLPTTSASAFSVAPEEEPGAQQSARYKGGLLILNARGERIHSSYTRTYPATQLAHDPQRDAIWVQARSTRGNLIATADALDSTCGVSGNCNDPGFVGLCQAVGYCLGRSDVSLSRYDSQLHRLQYATYLGNAHSSWPRALRLSARGDLYAAWGSAPTGEFFGGGTVHWLLWSAQDAITRIGALPIAPIDGPELPPGYWGSSGPLISASGEFVVTAASQGNYDATQPSLVRSAGLDPLCGATRPCVQLTRTLLPRGMHVTTLPALSIPAALLLLLIIGVSVRFPQTC